LFPLPPRLSEKRINTRLGQEVVAMTTPFLLSFVSKRNVQNKMGLVVMATTPCGVQIKIRNIKLRKYKDSVVSAKLFFWSKIRVKF